MALFSSLSRLVSGLTKTRTSLTERLTQVFTPGRKLDESAFAELEEALILSDLGAPLAAEIMQAVRKRARADGLGDAAGLSGLVRDELLASLSGAASSGAAPAPAPGTPRVVIVVGVNGGGKTTTVGKLAAREAAAGRSVVIAAADTFRAAAIEQVEIWATRAGATLVRGNAAGDPAAVVFDAARAAVTRRADLLIVDTAGRLHTRSNLMQELEKVVRVLGREIPGAPHEVLLVLDGTTGQNGISQAREFLRAANVTGIILTKLDGTARGGVALAITRELGLPLRYVGVGETVEDLLDFDPAEYITGLLGQSATEGRGPA